MIGVQNQNSICSAKEHHNAQLVDGYRKNSCQAVRKRCGDLNAKLFRRDLYECLRMTAKLI
jgi:hypothetical protein